MRRCVLLAPLISFACHASPDSGADELDTATDTDTDAGETEGSGELSAARGIGIVEVEANQATRVPIGLANGEWAGPEARNAHLVGERPTLIRVHVEVAEGWQPHPVTARLHVAYVGGDALVLDDERTIAASSMREELGSTFHFVLDTAASQPGATYEVELLELPEHQQGELPELAHHTPSAGQHLIGFEAAPMEIKLHVAPVHYTGAGMDRLPIIEQEQIDLLAQVIYEVNPVQRVTVEVGQPFEVSQTLSGLTDMFNTVVEARAAAALEPNVYFMALLDCGAPNCPNSAYTADIATDDITNDWRRVSIVVSDLGHIPPDNVLVSLGLNQGRLPADNPSPACVAPSGEKDPNYPYADGAIGNWGANPATLQLYPPERFDYMGHCFSYWVSDYTWEAAFERIHTLTSWDEQRPAMPVFLPGPSAGT